MTYESRVWNHAFGRAIRAKGQSIKSQFLALANGLATLASVLIASLLSGRGGVVPYLAFALSMGVLMPLFTISALVAAKRSSRERLMATDIVGADEQLLEHYDRTMSMIDALAVPEGDRYQLRHEAYRKYQFAWERLLDKSGAGVAVPTDGVGASDAPPPSPARYTDITSLVSGRGGSKG